MTTAYPLVWPNGWPRTRSDHRKDSRYAFKTASGDGWRKAVTFDVARKKLADELTRLGAQNIVVSTNLPLRNDGAPRAASAINRVDDPGVAVYFTLKSRPTVSMVMACDRYDAPSANMRSVGLAIEAMRQLERHGGGAMMERAFSGFAALPPPNSQSWRKVLGFGPEAVTTEDVQARYRRLAPARHPDSGGSEASMSELNAARDQALREVKPFNAGFSG